MDCLFLHLSGKIIIIMVVVVVVAAAAAAAATTTTRHLRFVKSAVYAY
jgi:flagellar basal body-associated protein FliL